MIDGQSDGVRLCFLQAQPWQALPGIIKCRLLVGVQLGETVRVKPCTWDMRSLPAGRVRCRSVCVCCVLPGALGARLDAFGDAQHC
jgi:hypothetical protein